MWYACMKPQASRRRKHSIVFADNLVAAVEADGTEKTIGKATFSGKSLGSVSQSKQH